MRLLLTLWQYINIVIYCSDLCDASSLRMEEYAVVIEQIKDSEYHVVENCSEGKF